MGLINEIIKFLNSNSFAGFATLFTGLIALLVYFRQKSEEKVKAARIILTEIRNAEREVQEISSRLDAQPMEDFPSVLPINSWKVYSHLFARDFDSDELELLTNFYGNCEQIEEYVRRHNNFFWITTEERTRVVQNKLADIVIGSLKEDGEVDSNKLASYKKSILDVYTNEPYAYAPAKTIDRLKNLVRESARITVTTAGTKLKKVAEVTN
jgi:hypothetical protein